MTTVSLGKITDTAGAATTIYGDRTSRCCELRFRAINANVALVNVGMVGFTRGGAGMIGEILKPNSGYSDEILIESEHDEIVMGDYAIWPATNGDGVYVSFRQR
ncbi:MAG: hypothetical protein NVS9B4_00720 [Candidatus Acidiferrum sp.]